MLIRSLITEIRFKLDGLRHAQAAMTSLQRQAQSIGNINFRATGIGRMVSEVHRLRQAAAAPIQVRFQSTGLPRLPGPGGAGGTGGGGHGSGIMAAASSIGAVGRNVVGGLSGIAAGFGAKALLTAGDAQTAQVNQLGAALDKVGGSASDVYEKLYRISQVTGVGMDAGVKSFVGLQNAVAEFGGQPDEVLRVVEGMQKAGAIAGSSTHDVAEAMRQFGQAMGKGKLDGDELKSILERMAPLGRIIAKN